MLFTVGRSRAHNGDVVDLLIACHHRVREHLALARRIASAPPTTAPDSVRAAAARICRYFTEAFPLHRADEEEDLFPLLIGRSDELDAAIGALIGDHEDHELHVARLVALCTTLEQDPAQLHAVAVDLNETARVLEDELLGHIMLEERTVFPAIATLSVEERQTVFDKIRARRDHSPEVG